MGGIGKTVLAKALTEAEVVRRAFPDGIIWLTAGQERKRDFIEEMREVPKGRIPAATTQPIRITVRFGHLDVLQVDAPRRSSLP